MISTATSELKVEGEPNYVEFITKSITSSNELTVFCCKCSSECNKSVKCCTVCGNNPSNFVGCENGDIPNGHPEEPPSIKLGEIIDQNPNSRESITLVLKDLCRQGGLGIVKKGIRIGFDGVPYLIACDIKEKLFQCLKCNVEIDEANTSLAFHLSEKHEVTDKLCLMGRKSIQGCSTSARSRSYGKKNPAISYIFAVSEYFLRASG